MVHFPCEGRKTVLPGMLSKILKSSPKVSDVECQNLVVCYCLTGRSFERLRYFIFGVKKFKVYQMSQQNTPEK
jgi:hypothetical protein